MNNVKHNRAPEYIYHNISQQNHKKCAPSWMWHDVITIIKYDYDMHERKDV